MMELEWNFGDRLRKIRREAGISQAEFADRINVGHGSLANWESDVSQCRNEVEVARAIEREFGVPASWTLGLDDPGLGESTTRGYSIDGEPDGTAGLSSVPALVTEDCSDMTIGTVDDRCDKVVDIPQENLDNPVDLGDTQRVREEPMSKLVASWCAARNFSPASTKQRSVLVGKFIESAGDPKVCDLKPEMVLKWWAEQGHLSAETRKSSRAALKGFIDFLKALGLVEFNPVEVISPPKVPRSVPKVLTADQVDQLRCSLVAEVDKIAVEAMLGAGLRCAEVSRLRAEHFRPDGLFEVTGKGSHTDLMPIPARLGELVDGHEGRLVPMTPGSVSNRLRRLLDEAGLPDHSAHSLRRTFATELLRLNDISVVQAALRHSSLQSTQHYVAATAAPEWRLPA
jgi:site-specific recombinase XerD/transcriptional regulator with XRE-family HTH domain